VSDSEVLVTFVTLGGEVMQENVKEEVDKIVLAYNVENLSEKN
jgi:hypothetical protein